MACIYHEKQRERLCGQHCLNNLLQGAYFSPVELSDLAHNIDNQERAQMAECGTETDSYREFIKAPSENVDDSGYFSVEVLKAALVPWNLELVPYNSSEERAKRARENPSEMSAYICNYHQHWYTIRKIGQQWFNLDSTLKGPKLLSETYLEMYLAQIRAEGHSIFVVFGDLPPCTADDDPNMCPVSEKTDEKYTHSPEVIDVDISDEDREDEKNLKLALQMSLREAKSNSSVILPNGQGNREIDIDELRRKRMQRFAQS